MAPSAPVPTTSSPESTDQQVSRAGVTSGAGKRRLRITLRTKVLLPVAAMIVLTTALSLFVINQVVRRQVFSKVSGELEQKIRIFDSLEKSQLDLLAERALVIANTPQLKAAIETDRATVQSLASKLFANLKDYALIILDPDRHVLAYIGAATANPETIALDAFKDAAEISGAKIGLLQLDNEYLQVAFVPELLPDPISNVFLAGYVLLGYPIDAIHIKALENMVGCNLVFYADNHVVRISEGLPVSLQTKIVDHVAGVAAERAIVQTFAAGDETFLGGYSRVQISVNSGYMLLSSVESMFRDIMRPIERTIFYVAALSLGVAILISLLISRQVLSPVQKLVRATDAVTAGDYNHAIAIAARDEIGYLAQKFDAMRRSLQHQMGELAERNRELEAALLQLEKTQHDLVQSEKLAATGKLTAQLSHELNNPIHNVRSCLESAHRKFVAGQDGGHFLDLAHEEIVRMGKLVHQMLDFYRPQATDRELVDLNRIVQNVVHTTQERLIKENVRVEWELAEQLPQIKGAPDQLKQVFLNIIMNAMDAMPSGGVLRIRSRCNERCLEVDFEDTGIGIPQDKIGSIFDAFYTTKSRASGVGLGLSVSYGLVRGHGGKILVQSRESGGSSFTVRLPVD